MIPDRLQYCLDDFWNFENFTKSWPYWAKSGPVDPVFVAFIIQKILQKMLESIWEHPGNLSLEIWEPKNSKIAEHACTKLLTLWNFEISKFWNFETMKLWNLENSKMRIGNHDDKQNREKLGYESHTYQNTCNGNFVNPKNVSIFKEGNHLTLISRK